MTYKLQKWTQGDWKTVGTNTAMDWSEVTSLYSEHENDAWFMTGEPCRLRIVRSDGLIMREQK